MPPPIAFFDLETRSKVDIKKHGLWRYATDPSTEIMLITVKFTGDEAFPSKTLRWAPMKYDGPSSNDWALPVDEELPDLWNKWLNTGGIVCASNAQFDRIVMAHTDEDFELQPPPLEQTICSQAQAESYSLPGKLSKQAELLRLKVQKDRRGANLIKLLCDANLPWNPTRPDLAAFWEYGVRDTDTLAAVFNACRPWGATEWQDYHCVERMNENGMLFDIEFAEAAMEFSEAEMAGLNEEFRKLTGDPTITIANSKRKVEWMWNLLEGTKLQESMVVETKRKNKRVKSRSTSKKVQTVLRERLEDIEEQKEDTDPLPPEVVEKVRAFNDIMERGAGVAAKKFAAASRVHDEGYLRHQYRCSPTITGRHSSRIVQVDNTVREELKDPQKKLEHPSIYAIDRIVEGATNNDVENVAQELEERFELPIQRILGRLVRPAIMAPEGHYLVWGDWNAAEPRILAWLARAERALKPWADGEPVYSIQAAKLFGGDGADIEARYKEEDPEATWQRLIGKITILALGYQGGAGALIGMARNYGIRLTEAEAERFKVAFRQSNGWLTRFWADLQEAFWSVVDGGDGAMARAGRITYRRVGNDIWALLPDMRPIVYPEVRIEEVYKERWDDVATVVTYRKRYGDSAVRGELYGGILCENVTQGGCASLLRDLHRRLDGRGWKIVGTTHDEIRAVVAASSLDEAEVHAAELQKHMLDLPDWAAGLPMKAEAKAGTYYSK